MKELQKIVNDKITALVEEGVIEKLIDDGVQKAVESAFNKQFESYGKLTRQIDDLLDEKLKIDASKIDLPTYNEVMVLGIKQKINEFWETQAAERMCKSIDKLFAPVESEMTVQKFCETIVEKWREECHDYDDIDQYATVEITESEVSGGHNIRIWKKKEERSYLSTSSRERRADIDLWVGNEGKIRLRHNWNPTVLHDEDSFIVKAYACNMTLTGMEEANPDFWNLQLHEYD